MVQWSTWICPALNTEHARSAVRLTAIRVCYVQMQFFIDNWFSYLPELIIKCCFSHSHEKLPANVMTMSYGFHDTVECYLINRWWCILSCIE